VAAVPGDVSPTPLIIIIKKKVFVHIVFATDKELLAMVVIITSKTEVLTE
jgi:hypothetical protein